MLDATERPTLTIFMGVGPVGEIHKNLVELRCVSSKGKVKKIELGAGGEGVCSFVPSLDVESDCS